MVAALIVGFILLSLQYNKLYSTSINVPSLKSFKPDLLIEPLVHKTGTPIRWPLRVSTRSRGT